MKRWILLSFFLSFYFTSASAQVRPLGLSEIVNSAKSTFVGTVTKVRYGYDEHHDIVTYTTFKVQEQVAGVTPSTYTIKQLGGVMDGLDTRLEHIRYFHQGERVMLASYPKSSQGFSNPVGLDQGVWRVTKSNEVLGITPRQLQDVAAILPKHGIAQSVASSMAPVSIQKKNFESLIRAIAVTKGGNAQ